jgi:hypothetical protein
MGSESLLASNIMIQTSASHPFYKGTTRIILKNRTKVANVWQTPWQMSDKRHESTPMALARSVIEIQC